MPPLWMRLLIATDFGHSEVGQAVPGEPTCLTDEMTDPSLGTLDPGLWTKFRVGVTTGAFNQAIKRNLARFPDDFSFPAGSGVPRFDITNCDIKRTWWSAKTTARLHRARGA